MRLGELMLQHRVLTPEQLRSGLDAQRTHGGRLGTHLFQLGYVDVDLLSRALGQQRGFPAALRKHVAAIDPRIIAVVPAETALAYHIIPVGLTDSSPPRIVVAAADPDRVPVEELAFESGSRVDVWIAPEIVIAECLEKYYGGPPVPAYAEVDVSPRVPLRSSAPSVPRRPRSTAPDTRSVPPSGRAPPRAPSVTAVTARERTPVPPPPDSEPPDSQPIPSIRTSTRPPLRAARNELQPPFALASPPPPRAVYQPSLVPTGPEIPDLPPEDGWDMAEEPGATASRVSFVGVVDQAAASRFIATATSKDEIGEALVAWLRSTFGGGLVLVVKGEMAVGWKGHFPDNEDVAHAVAVALGTPSVLRAAYERKLPYWGPPDGEGGDANRLFWEALRVASPEEVLVCPIVVGKRAVNLVYAHPVSQAYVVTEAILRDAQILAADASVGYVRLIRERST